MASVSVQNHVFDFKVFRRLILHGPRTGATLVHLQAMVCPFVLSSPSSGHLPYRSVCTRMSCRIVGFQAAHWLISFVTHGEQRHHSAFFLVCRLTLSRTLWISFSPLLSRTLSTSPCLFRLANGPHLSRTCAELTDLRVILLLSSLVPHGWFLLYAKQPRASMIQVLISLLFFVRAPTIPCRRGASATFCRCR